MPPDKNPVCAAGAGASVAVSGAIAGGSARRSAALEHAGALSHWQLVRLRFRRHRLATFSLFLLLVVYGIAALADFAAPYDAAEQHLDFAYAPPQVPRFSFEHGLHVCALRRFEDPVTLQKTYREDHDAIISLRLFAVGGRTRFWGLVPIERRLFGVDRGAWEGRGGAADAAAGSEPTIFLLGADKYGRDILSRIIHGSRVSLSIGMVSIVLTFVIGVTLGGASGYFGGAVDTVIQRLVEVFGAFPQIPLWLALAAVLPAEWSAISIYFAITLVLSALNWTGLARVVRGQMLSLREEDFAVAARLLGAGHGRIVFRHLLPGITSHIIVVLTMSVPAMILGETALSFLKLGLRPPVVSWGVMLQDCESLQAVGSYPWLLAPVLPIVGTVLCFNFLGDGLRDAVDPHAPP
jgi:peptide/nickel transport system permease protein